MELTVIGSGDAFGSGGRLQTCFHVTTANKEFLIDCGATALIGFHKLGRDPNRVGTIFISHLHGDHFSGLVWWLLHALHVSGRTEPLDIVGPEGTAERYAVVAEALFPGSTRREPRHRLTWHELKEGQVTTVNDISVKPYPVCHPSGAPSYALRILADGKSIGFSGDTEWVEALTDVAADADLYISECFGFDEPSCCHMNWRVIEQNLDRLTSRRIMLTHMSPVMLANRDKVRNPRVIIAEDGLTLDV
ncbi:MAG: MBL fold metallo-hydrolase [Hyphomicrobiaceae bacterium]|nr:MBL fold metallo-hydrolase [Hyphomicrobiaceae bacterium]